MDEIANLIANFCQTLKQEILEYYDRCHSYIRDLFADKSIDLTFKVSYEPPKKVQATLDTMVKSIKLALNTIGVSKKRIVRDEEVFRELTTKKTDEYPTYEVYFIKGLKNTVEQILFEILIEYLDDRGRTKIENLDLFDLLPRKFIDKLDEFKFSYIDTPEMKSLISDNISKIISIVNPTDLTIIHDGITVSAPQKLKRVKEKPQVLKEEIKPEEPVKKLLEQLEEAKKINLEALKMSIKQSLNASVKEVPPTPIEPPVKEVPPTPIEPPVKEVPPTPIEPPVKEIPPTPIEPLQLEEIELYIDYFGNFPSVNIDVMRTFNIDKTNFLHSHVIDRSFFNLETLYYYIAISKMLNEKIPFTKTEILELSKEFINGKVFSSSMNNPPDPISMFYGLSIYSEFNLVNNTDVIDLLEIEMFLESELSNFLPDKLHLNYHSLLCMKILEKSGAIITDKSHLISPIIGLSLTGLEEYNPILDIYEQVSCIKLLDKDSNISHFRELYIEEIKKFITVNGSVKDTITDSARVLLILDMFGLKKQKFQLSQKILRYLVTAGKFFQSNDIPDALNWQYNKLGYAIELRMLYWALLASSRYAPII